MIGLRPLDVAVPSMLPHHQYHDWARDISIAPPISRFKPALSFVSVNERQTLHTIQLIIESRDTYGIDKKPIHIVMGIEIPASYARAQFESRIHDLLRSIIQHEVDECFVVQDKYRPFDPHQGHKLKRSDLAIPEVE